MIGTDNIGQLVKSPAFRRCGLAGLHFLFALLVLSLASYSLPSAALDSGFTPLAVTDGDFMNDRSHPCDAGHAAGVEHCHMAAGFSVSIPNILSLAPFTKIASEHWLMSAALHHSEEIDPQIRPPQASIIS